MSDFFTFNDVFYCTEKTFNVLDLKRSNKEKRKWDIVYGDADRCLADLISELYKGSSERHSARLTMREEYGPLPAAKFAKLREELVTFILVNYRKLIYYSKAKFWQAIYWEAYRLNALREGVYIAPSEAPEEEVIN